MSKLVSEYRKCFRWQLYKPAFLVNLGGVLNYTWSLYFFGVWSGNSKVWWPDCDYSLGLLKLDWGGCFISYGQLEHVLCFIGFILHDLVTRVFDTTRVTLVACFLYLTHTDRTLLICLHSIIRFLIRVHILFVVADLGPMFSLFLLQSHRWDHKVFWFAREGLSQWADSLSTIIRDDTTGWKRFEYSLTMCYLLYPGELVMRLSLSGRYGDQRLLIFDFLFLLKGHWSCVIWFWYFDFIGLYFVNGIFFLKDWFIRVEFFILQITSWLNGHFRQQHIQILDCRGNGVFESLLGWVISNGFNLKVMARAVLWLS